MKLDSSAFAADPELVEMFESKSISILCDADRVLFREGESPAGFYILHSGAATLSTRCNQNSFQISVETNAPSMIGLPGLLRREPHAFTAVARRGAQLSFVNRDDFDRMVGSDPGLLFKVLQVLAAAVASLRQAILNQIGLGDRGAAFGVGSFRC